MAAGGVSFAVFNLVGSLRGLVEGICEELLFFGEALFIYSLTL